MRLVIDPVRHQEVISPIAAGQDGGGDTHLARAGAGVDHLAAAQIDAHVARGHGAALEYQDVAPLDLAHAVDPGIPGTGPPGAAGHIAAAEAGLLHAPIDEAGAVEPIGPLGAAHVGAAQLAFGDGNELLYALLGGIHRGCGLGCGLLGGLGGGFTRLGRGLRRGFARLDRGLRRGLARLDRGLRRGFGLAGGLDSGSRRGGLGLLGAGAVQLLQGLRAYGAVGAQAVAPLELLHGALRDLAVEAADLGIAGKIPQSLQPLLDRLDVRALHAQLYGVRLDVPVVHGAHGGRTQASVGRQIVVLLELADGGDGGVVHLAFDLIVRRQIAQLLEPLLIGGDGVAGLSLFEKVAHHLVAIEDVQCFMAHHAVALESVGLLEISHRGAGLFPVAAGDKALAQIPQLIQTSLDILHVVPFVAILHDAEARGFVHEQQPGALPQLTVGVQVIMLLEAHEGGFGDAAKVFRRFVAVHVAQFHEPGLNDGHGGRIISLFQDLILQRLRDGRGRSRG